MSTELAKQQASAVPALVNTPALEIEGGDVALSKIYIGHYQSKLVQNEDNDVKAGQIYAATGEEDTEPVVLWDPNKKGENPGLLFHVLGMRKGKSVTIDGELQTWAFNDPEAHPDSWVTYNYAVVLPEEDETQPYKMLFTRTKAAAAKQINTVLKKNEGRGPAWGCAFRMTTAPRENPKGKYFVPRITIVEATDANVAIASSLVELVADSVQDSPAISARSDEPTI